MDRTGVIEARVKNLEERLDALTGLLLDESDDEDWFSSFEPLSLEIEGQMRRFGTA